MIRLLALGAVDLLGTEGRPVLSVLSQPKRLALLAYLALATPRGPQRRDTLLALFWPETDDERARAALSQALHVLRRSLGAGTLVSRGNEDVGVDVTQLWCDASAFEEALDAGEFETALELYRSRLLEGFFLEDAPGFERWLEGERARLQTRAGVAAWVLADRAEGAGDAASAARWARRAVALTESDEGAVRRLIALLDRAGDRTGAVREYEEFARRLRDDYELEPSAETRALVERVRSQNSAARPVIVHASPPGGNAGSRDRDAEPPEVAGLDPRDSPAAPTSTVTESSASARDAPAPPGRPRVRRALPLVALLLLLLAVGGRLIWRMRAPTDPSASTAARVAVLPFGFHGSGDFAYLGDGMVSLLSTNLDGAGELRSVDPRALMSAIDQTEVRGVSPERGRAIAERFGAGLYVLGDIVEAGGRLRITAALYDRRGGTAVDETTVEGEGDQLFALVDELTAQLLAGRSTQPGQRLARIAALTTHSLPALKAYLESESDFRGGRYAWAVEGFGRAVELDSTFALAHYRLSSAATWLNSDSVPGPEAEAAVRHSGRLSEPDRMLVAAWNAYVYGAADRAEQLYQGVLTLQPHNVEAWSQLGEVQFHWMPMLGHPASEARPAFERVLFYEPENVAALIHLARIAAGDGKRAELNSLVTRALTLDPAEDQVLELQALRAFTSGDQTSRERITASLNRASAPAVTGAFNAVAVSAGDLAGAAGLARALVAPNRDRLQQARGHLILAQLETARGRRSAANAELAEAARLQPAWATQYHAAWATLPFVRTPRAELEAIRARLSDAPTHLGRQPVMSSPDQLRPIYAPRQLYLLGLLSVRLGDSGSALESAAQLERLGGGPMDSAFGRVYAGLLRAQLSSASQQPVEALRALGEAALKPDSLLPELTSFPKADERFLRAELLRALRRDREALRWYETFPDPSRYDLVYLAPSHLHRAEIYERLGEPAQAAEHYARFIELWRDADPELQPLVRQARERLAGIRAAERARIGASVYPGGSVLGFRSQPSAIRAAGSPGVRTGPRKRNGFRA